MAEERMAEERGVVRKIEWREIFPWLLIFRSFGVACNVSVIAVATLGVLISPLGWLAAEYLFQVESGVTAELPVFPSALEVEVDSDEKGVQIKSVIVDSNHSPFRFEEMPYPNFSPGSMERLPLVFVDFVSSFREMFSNQKGLGRFCYFLFGAIWMIAVWAPLGGAITRIAVVQLGREERQGLVQAMTFSLKKFTAFFASPLFPLLFSLLFIVPMGILGLLMSFNLGALVAAVLWGFVLLAAFVVTVLLLGMLFGWPLMWAAISAEGSDSFDALSRSFAYTFQRPLKYIFYIVVAVLFGGLCLFFVDAFTDKVISIAHWGTSWGANVLDADRSADIMHAAIDEKDETLAATSGKIILFWDNLARLIATGFAYGLFWALASAIYLLRRLDVDDTEFDEIFIEGDELSYGLPELKAETIDEPEIPVVDHSEMNSPENADSNGTDSNGTDPPADRPDSEDKDSGQS